MNGNTDDYFNDYEDLEVHELMLKDRPRQEAYYNAIMQNESLFQDKVVLDVGAGTGILSAFCAKAGARKVYAVEASQLATVALQIMDENNLTAVVEVVHSRIEDFTLPAADEKVDIIVSEWMGFYLLHEAMLDSVLYARDHFLRPDGVMFPREATIHVAPCSVPSRYDDWHRIDGVRMTRFAAMLREQKSSKPEIMYLKPKDLLHAGTVVHWMNLQDVDPTELQEIIFKGVLAAEHSGKHQGFCLWFECRFPNENYENAVVLSTSPWAQATHWKQCVIVLPEDACQDVEEGCPIAFSISLKRKTDQPRRYNLEVEVLDPHQE